MKYMDNDEISIDDYSAIKDICSFIRKTNKIEDNETRNIIKNKILYLNKYYIEIYNKDNPKCIRTKCLIENSIRKGIKKEPMKIMLEFLNEVELCNLDKISFIVFYLKYYDKKLDLLINK